MLLLGTVSSQELAAHGRKGNLLAAGWCCDSPHVRIQRKTKLFLYTPKCSFTKWKSLPLLEGGLAHHGSQSQCSMWKESPKHPIPRGKKKATEGLCSARTPHPSETTLEMIIQPLKENHSFTSLGRDLPSHQGGHIPRKSQNALSSGDPGPGSSAPVALLRLISQTNGPEGTSCGKFSFEYHGAETNEELGLLSELGAI